MNILIPDSWMREYVDTNASPADIQRCLSLCGPSIERTEKVGNDVIYDVEITTNRVDTFAVYGFAREASAILPEFGCRAKLLPLVLSQPTKSKKIDITIEDPRQFCKRILAIKLENIMIGPSPAWLQERLEKVGQRPLNNIIDITNYVMWETGHPCHAFDWDRLVNKTIMAREAKKGEHMITLDGKKHVLRGGELIFDDGTGEIIDFPGIMGTANTVVTEQTKNVLLFVENSDPVHIRYGSMGLGIRTQAAAINEKGPDPELAYTTIVRAANLACDVTGATMGSALFDHFPGKVEAKPVTISHGRLVSYLNTDIAPKRVTSILKALGFTVKGSYTVMPPSFRAQDITIPEDVIEEVARIYGYHNISLRLPDGEMPAATPDPQLTMEEEVKIRLRDWGYTELLTYSMISQELMDIFGLDRSKAYKITNPLSSEWEYLRPSLQPSVLMAVKENLNRASALQVFELSKIYRFRENNLPQEEDILVVAWSGDHLFEAKGLAEAIFDLFGIHTQTYPGAPAPTQWKEEGKNVSFGAFGSVGIVRHDLPQRLGIQNTVTILDLSVTRLVKDAQPVKRYAPIPKYPAVVEDLAFVVPEQFEVGPLIAALKDAHPLVASVTLLDIHEDTRTFHITYQNPENNLTTDEIVPIRQQLIDVAKNRFGALQKSA